MFISSLNKYCESKKWYLGPQTSFQFLQFLSWKHRVTFSSPFIINRIEKSKVKTVLLEKKTLRSRGRGQCPTIIMHLLLFIYIPFLLNIFRIVTVIFISLNKSKISSNLQNIYTHMPSKYCTYHPISFLKESEVKRFLGYFK